MIAVLVTGALFRAPVADGGRASAAADARVDACVVGDVLTARAAAAGAPVLVMEQADAHGVVSLPLWAPPSGAATWRARVVLPDDAASGETLTFELTAADAPSIPIEALRARAALVASVTKAPAEGAVAGGPHVHHQPVPAAVWEVHHNLGLAAPAIVTVDSSGRSVGGRVEYPSPDLAVLTFGAPFGGVAYVYP